MVPSPPCFPVKLSFRPIRYQNRFYAFVMADRAPNFTQFIFSAPLECVKRKDPRDKNPDKKAQYLR